MKIWLITQDSVTGYDTYDSAVVAAETELMACSIHPGGYGDPIGKDFFPCWAKEISQVKAKYLGEAAPEIERGVICASFNAG